MKEKLYTIPVMDGFKEDCECPFCAMYHTLEDNAIAYTMGPSYMEEDSRAITDKKGFCREHLDRLYKHQNRLGLALILHTHMEKTTKDIEKLSKTEKTVKTGLFKKTEKSKLLEYLDTLQKSCFICERVEETFERYYATVFYLFQNNEEFPLILKGCKGFCTKHYQRLLELAPKYLSNAYLDNFLSTINQLYLENFSRVKEELDWFIDKFNYENEKKPWGTSKDALPRSMVKTGSIYYQLEKK